MKQAIKRPDSHNGREAIFALERYMIAQNNPVDIEVVHRFAPGVYTREMIVPAGVMLTGYIHKTEHISIFLQGRMLVTNGEGQSVEIVAPIVETAMPGVKRAGIALEEVRWITIHPTEETDIDRLEDLLVTNDFSEVEHLVDQQDYKLVAQECGLESLIPELEKIEWYRGDISSIRIAKSKRHGLGVFVADFVAAGAIIAPAIKNGKMMEYSRFANHSMNPNAYCVADGNSVNFVALRDIENEEVTVNYRNTVPRL